MKYTEIDLQIEDIMWFGIDKNGIIFEATTGGCANVPAFVINSREDNEQLNNYFMSLGEGHAESKLLEELNPDYPAFEDCISLTKNGITCFDVDAEETNLYKKIATTSLPKKIDDLPDNIKQIIATRKIDFNVLESSKISVEHGI